MYSEEGGNTWNDRVREDGIKFKTRLQSIFQSIPPFIERSHIKYGIWDVLLDTVY